MDRNTEITKIKGVGAVTAAKFGKLGITSVGELLEHFPKAYEEYRLPVPVNSLFDGETASVEVCLLAAPKVITRGKTSLVAASAKDRTGTIELVWFNQTYRVHELPLGKHLILRGKAEVSGHGVKMTQPDIFTKEKYLPMLKSLRPIYGLTAGLTRNAVLKAVEAALKEYKPEDRLPLGIRRKYRLTGSAEAYRNMHFPKDVEMTREAIRRFAFEEFFTFLVTMRLMKEQLSEEPNSHCCPAHSLSDRVRASLPFTLTGGQEQAMEDIFGDLNGAAPMNRLLQGDVGSGKTAVAMLSLTAVVENGFQGALMAPTEVLARQHFEEFSRVLGPFGIRVGFLAGSLSQASKKKVREQAENGGYDILIGTHALLSDGVIFHRLGLAVIDEQHRFGVKQREKLAEKGEGVHVLIMSATPIPRTLAVMLYGEMDITVLSELPKNRLPVKSCLIDRTRRPSAVRFLYEHIRKGEQAYVICPMVEESEDSLTENVLSYTEKLKSAFSLLAEAGGEEKLSPISVDYVHGRLSAEEKNRKMTAFSEGRTSVLVSTTVIEVGINVPNATVILIENAERFGLASLHQLRGRVGRGSLQSYCILVSGNGGEGENERLSALVKSNDGFFLAEEDLRLRGPGDFFGIRQSGELGFRVADIFRDRDMLLAAKECCDGLSDEELRVLKGELVAETGSGMVY